MLCLLKSKDILRRREETTYAVGVLEVFSDRLWICLLLGCLNHGKKADLLLKW